MSPELLVMTTVSNNIFLIKKKKNQQLLNFSDWGSEFPKWGRGSSDSKDIPSSAEFTTEREGKAGADTSEEWQE